MVPFHEILLFYFRVKGTKSNLSVSCYKVQITLRENARKEKNERWGEQGWGWWCINLLGVCREGNSYAEEQEAHVASKLPGNWYSLV